MPKTRKKNGEATLQYYTFDIRDIDKMTLII